MLTGHNAGSDVLSVYWGESLIEGIFIKNLLRVLGDHLVLSSIRILSRLCGSTSILLGAVGGNSWSKDSFRCRNYIRLWMFYATAGASPNSAPAPRTPGTIGLADGDEVARSFGRRLGGLEVESLSCSSFSRMLSSDTEMPFS